jgi:hypothetical protein
MDKIQKNKFTWDVSSLERLIDKGHTSIWFTRTFVTEPVHYTNIMLDIVHIRCP